MASSADVEWIGVRHHSPAAARLVRELILERRPAHVLIEGPSDFTAMDELALPHQMPIAIYSSAIVDGHGRVGAYYPFCVHSPEWQAIRAGREVGADVRFIDLPWVAVAGRNAVRHRYGDHELRMSAVLPAVCDRLGVDDFDAAWDRLVEVDADLDLETYRARCHTLCAALRGDGVSTSDQRRETFMAARIQQARGSMVVVCGAFHVAGLQELLAPGTPITAEDVAHPVPGDGRVVALTPYSFRALDSYTGYEAGMPNPGFYDAAWRARADAGRPAAEIVVERIVLRLREAGVEISAADLIALRSAAAGLASLRGHSEVWRTDLLDGVLGALVKDEQEAGLVHPVLEATREVLRGGARGRLSDGVSEQPFVADLRQALETHGLVPEPRARKVDLDLIENGLPASRILHRIATVEIPGFDAIDVVSRPERDDLRERWRIREVFGFDGAAIEAAAYGPTLAAAAAARLLERLARAERDAGAAAAVLVDVALCGLDQVAGPLLEGTRTLVAGDPDIASVAEALRIALHLFHYDRVLGTADDDGLGGLVSDCFARTLWLLDPGGGGVPEDAGVDAIAGALECFERCAVRLDLPWDELVAVLQRLHDEDGAAPAVRGAALGALWLLEVADGDQLATAPALFADPGLLGDFLHGLFRLARDPVQRRPELIERIDAVIAGFDDMQFLDAAPPLRRAFSRFTPREKDNLARTLFAGAAPPELRDAEPETLAAMAALEARVRDALGALGL